MSHRFIYLAYPIDQASDAYTKRSRVAVVNVLGGEGVGAYDPGAGWTVASGLDAGPEIARVNHHAMSVCTGAIAWLPKGVPTIGVPTEIERMTHGWAMPVAVITDNTSSWSLYEQNGRVKRFRPGEESVAAQWLLAQEPGATPFGERDAIRMAPLYWTRVDNGLPYEQEGREPVRAYPDDAGLDLYVADTVVIEPGQFVDIPSGVAVEMPPHVWGMLTGRSSTLRKKGLLVNQGIIDPGYRGELYSGVWNLSDAPVEVKAGERIAQLILIGNQTRMHVPVEVGSLGESDRGGNGFGSSGA